MHTGAAAKLLSSAVLAGLLMGCTAVANPGHGGHPPGGDQVHIPPGHLPPPGACRIWFPDRPPGQPPPPGPCRALRHQVPWGAVLVHG